MGARGGSIFFHAARELGQVGKKHFQNAVGSTLVMALMAGAVLEPLVGADVASESTIWESGKKMFIHIKINHRNITVRQSLSKYQMKHTLKHKENKQGKNDNLCIHIGIILSPFLNFSCLFYSFMS